jgi:hypothetical protein
LEVSKLLGLIDTIAAEKASLLPPGAGQVK